MEAKIVVFKGSLTLIEGKDFIKNNLACFAEFKIIMPDELKNLK
jgi:hypothetical protein